MLRAKWTRQASPAQGVSERNNITLASGLDHSRVILVKNLATFPPCLKNLCEADKSLGADFIGSGGFRTVER